MTLGDLTKAINAQNTTLQVGGLGEVLTLYNIRTTDESVIDRRNTRGGSIDTPTFGLFEITADCVISKDLYDHFILQRVLTSRGVLPSEAYIITGEAPAPADDVTASGDYVLRRMETVAQEQGRYEVTLTMRMVPPAAP